ncbi:ribosomal protein L17 [Cutaneotrichosporon oleaginosum]|uniref:Ribosomal protein L17 n=1 Tax=Cutaneotrichosporon oleaginosum TaxID=879819 RepID=A0A0J0XCI7_9TREE|nr:ribosomal protein L17 [Cutaneotrichosporon oleaginosum]KLT38785.1 ribosomal protein L17 [Cutaneotrichosporon oleaginosum]TXT09944.1 hypothetical protein COLE_03878 [Cutaneotrichosporon oleaginosum]
MKHGLKMRKLQRTSSHRYALLRNLVSALLHHEMIKTTVPKAKEAARMAEKIITLGKKGTNVARSNAQAFLMPAHHYTSEAYNAPVTPTLPPSALEDPEAFVPSTSLLPKVFGPLAQRYADRPGGYTRIQRFGKRPGDNAPVAILSLVDGPRDLKFEMAARAAARETLTSGLLPRTRRSVERVLKYRGDEGKAQFKALQEDYSLRLRAEGDASYPELGHQRDGPPARFKFRPHSFTKPQHGRKLMAGERLPGVPIHYTGLGIARGALGRKPQPVEQLFVGEVPKAADITKVD